MILSSKMKLKENPYEEYTQFKNWLLATEKIGKNEMLHASEEEIKRFFLKFWVEFLKYKNWCEKNGISI